MQYPSLPPFITNVTTIRHSRKPKKAVRQPSNEQIRSREVRVIGATGEQLGVMDTRDAIAQARDQGLDLIMVSPKAEPPVCRIANYGAFIYNQEKKERKQKAKQKKIEVKGIRISLKIGPHDLENRKRQALKFLMKGDKTKVELILRGRERAYADRGNQILQQFANDLAAENPAITIEKNVSRQGNRLFLIIGMKK